jgi:hypothetical protein
MPEMPREIQEIDGPEAAVRVMQTWGSAPLPQNVRVTSSPGTPPAFVSTAPHAIHQPDKIDALIAEFRELKMAILQLVNYKENT